MVTPWNAVSSSFAASSTSIWFGAWGLFMVYDERFMVHGPGLMERS